MVENSTFGVYRFCPCHGLGRDLQDLFSSDFGADAWMDIRVEMKVWMRGKRAPFTASQAVDV